jgi:hypothetical protein
MTDITPTEATPPEAEPGKSVREAVLDHLLDTVESGPQSIQQIVEATKVDRNGVDQALHRLCEAGDALRVDRGTYKLAPPKPRPPSKPETPASTVGGRTYEEWLADLEAWYANPASWDVATLGPRPDGPGNRVPATVLMMYRRRLDARKKAAEEQRTAAAVNDVELLKQLIEAAHSNVVDGPDLRDISPILKVLDTVPLEQVLYAIHGKHDPRVYPKNPAVKSWRDQALLREIAERFCRNIMVPRMIEVWSKAPAAKAPGAAAERVSVSAATPRAPPAPQTAQAAPGAPETAPSGNNGTDLAPARASIAANLARNRPEPQSPGEQEAGL